MILQHYCYAALLSRKNALQKPTANKLTQLGMRAVYYFEFTHKHFRVSIVKLQETKFYSTPSLYLFS